MLRTKTCCRGDLRSPADDTPHRKRTAGRWLAAAFGIPLSVKRRAQATRPTAKMKSMRIRRRPFRIQICSARVVGDADPYEALSKTGCRAATCGPPKFDGGAQVPALRQMVTNCDFAENRIFFIPDLRGRPQVAPTGLFRCGAKGEGQAPPLRFCAHSFPRRMRESI